MNLYRNIFFGPLLVGAVLTGCHNTPEPSPSPTAPSLPQVQTFALTSSRLQTTMSLPGELRPFQEVDIYAKVNSFVKQMYVDVGSQVVAGQLLATMEAPELTDQLKETESTLHTKEAVYRGSRLMYDRLYRTSRIPGTISPNDLDNAYAKMSADSSDLLAARSRYEQAISMNSYLEIRAPFAGVISTRNVYAGAYVGPAGKGSDKPMLTLQEQAKLRLVIAVPEAAVKGLKGKDTIHFSVKALPNKTFAASISRMAGSMSEDLRTEQVEMDVDNKDKQLLPGMYAQVSVEIGDRQPTFVVPATAITGNSQSVFVIRVSNNQAKWVAIQKGKENKDSVEVFGSLTNGDQLILKASDELRDGTTVQIR